MGARYYAPTLARFISRDPIGFDGGINLYTYCVDDPINLIDPSGTSPGDSSSTNGYGGVLGDNSRYDTGKGSPLDNAYRAARLATLYGGAAFAAMHLGTATATGGNVIPWVTAGSLAAAEEAAVIDGLNNLAAGSRPPYGRKWGDVFQNRGDPLPTADEFSGAVNYTEHYLPKGPNDVGYWGERRLVAGSDGAVYYTWDHYRHFVRVRLSGKII